jgi:DNA-binding IclR family transcriptional regulator
MTEHRVVAVERALSILASLRAGREAMTLQGFSRETGLHKSTVLRLCASLERLGFLTRDADGRFSLGPIMWRLSQLSDATGGEPRIIRQALTGLAESVGETAAFYVREGNHRVCLFRCRSPQPLLHDVQEGALMPLDRGASGHVLEAFGEARPKALEGVRNAGYAVSHGEQFPDAVAVAAPVFTQGSRLLGAIGIIGVKTRFDASTEARCIELVATAARNLSDQFGAGDPEGADPWRPSSRQPDQAASAPPGPGRRGR